MNKNYIVKEENKFVIATMGNPTYYLRKTPSINEYAFVDDISAATKIIGRDVAEQILKYYYIDTGTDTDLVIVPMKITYELINETN